MQFKKPTRRRRLQREQSPIMQKLSDLCVENYNLHLSLNGQRRAVTILKMLHLTGVESRENLTLGGLSRAVKVLNMLQKRGLVGFQGQDVYITGEGLKLGDSLGFKE